MSGSNEAAKEMRVNRFIADSGFCSRREADKLIESGRVTVNGEKIGLGSKLFPNNDVLCIDHQPISARQADDYVYIALNKPRGITCTTDLRRRDNIVSFMNYPERIYPVGRLDRDSEGLILLTNDGSIVNKILRAGNRHDKEYLVRVDRPFDETFLKAMAEGVEILGQKTLPALCRRKGADRFRITIHQGLNRQIRRMCEALGYEVLELRRLRIMHITLGQLKSGEWRYLGKKELRDLYALLEDSRNNEDNSLSSAGCAELEGND